MTLCGKRVLADVIKLWVEKRRAGPVSSEWALSDVRAVPVTERKQTAGQRGGQGMQPPAEDAGSHHEPHEAEADAPMTLCRGHRPAGVLVPAQRPWCQTLLNRETRGFCRSGPPGCGFRHGSHWELTRFGLPPRPTPRQDYMGQVWFGRRPRRRLQRRGTQGDKGEPEGHGDSVLLATL